VIGIDHVIDHREKFLAGEFVLRADFQAEVIVRIGGAE
jgi:hypothetical protein